MFVPFARLLRMWDERPEHFDAYETHSLHWVFKWTSAGMLNQPHIPLASVANRPCVRPSSVSPRTSATWTAPKGRTRRGRPPTGTTWPTATRTVLEAYAGADEADRTVRERRAEAVQMPDLATRREED